MISSTAKLVQVGQAVSHFLAAMLKWARPDFVWGLLVVPVLFVALIYSLCDANFLGWSDSDVFKPLMEMVHPILLAGFFLLCTPFAVKVSRAANLTRFNTNPHK